MLLKGLKQIGISEDKDKVEKILEFVREIKLWNPKYSLISKNDNLIVKHVLDALAAESILEDFNFKSIADMGSGAGFPGIPLSIWMKRVNFTLIERSEKRCSFLKNMKYILNLDNVRILNRDIADINERFDCIVFRALFSLTKTIMSDLCPIVNTEKNSAIIAYKGKRENIIKEVKEIKSIYCSKIIPLKVPFLEEERNLLIISCSRQEKELQ